MAGASSEYTAPILSAYLYGINDPEKLTQEQKDTVTSIITLASTATTYGVTGNTSSAVNAGEVGKGGVENNYFYPIRNEIPIDILNLNIQGDERYVVYALAEYMVKQRMLELYDVPSFVYSDMVSGSSIVDFDTKETINENPTEEDYRKNFNTGNIISHDQFEALIKKHPQAYNRLIEGISNQKTLNGIKDLGLKVTGGLSGVAVSFGQMAEPFIHPIETAEALYQFVTTEDKLLAIQLAVAMDLQNRQELLELHHQNNDTFGVALETSKNTADALLVLGSIHKAPKEIVTLIPTLKNAGSVVFNGVKYTYSEGKIFAQKILSPNTKVNAHVPTNKDLPKVYGDGDLENVSNYGNPNTPADRNIADKKTVDSSTGTHNPHYDTKHGAYTSLKDQYDRAMTGYSPNLGVTNHKVDNASKFFNSTDMEYAMREAERLYALNPSAYTTYKPDGTIKQITVPIDFNRPVGEGYIKNNKTTQANGTAGEYRWTNSVSVGLDKTTKKPYTAFPDISKGIKKPDPLKVR